MKNHIPFPVRFDFVFLTFFWEIIAKKFIIKIPINFLKFLIFFYICFFGNNMYIMFLCFLDTYNFIFVMFFFIFMFLFFFLIEWFAYLSFAQRARIFNLKDFQ